MVRDDTALRLLRAVTCAVLMVVAAAARAEDRAQDAEQDAAVQRVYATIEPRIRAEIEFQMRGMMNSPTSTSRIEFFQNRMRLLAYNRATLIAYCVADAERDRPPTAARVPWQNNLMLTTCVDEKVGQLQKFSQLAAYADFFFPERIEECGERVRLPEREKLLQPYAFLIVEQPKLYDFARYNECLMKH